MTTATKTRRTRKTTDKPSPAELRDQLEEFIGDADEDTQRLMAIRFLGKYSVRNSLLILMQNPDATDVAGYGDWQKVGRQVRKGEHGLQILAPAGSRTDKIDESKPDGDPKNESTRKFFRLAYVFDISQTDPIQK